MASQVDQAKQQQAVAQKGSLQAYLDGLASEQVKCELVSGQARRQLRERLARVTIDQLAYEKDQTASSLQSLKLAFAREELSH